MSNKSILRNAIGEIQPNKPRVIPKTRIFTPPLSHESQGEQTQGNLPQVEGTQVYLPQGNSTQGDLTPSPSSWDLEIDSHLADRKIRRREKMIEGALVQSDQLNPETQARLVNQHIAEGWGRLAHCVTRQLKAPTRHGFKLVDLALILTIYDRTIAQVIPRMFAPITIEDFESDTGMDGSNIRAALRELVKKSILQKISHKTVNFWGLNHSYFERISGGNRTHGKLTQGNLPQVHTPHDKKGDLPPAEIGSTTPSHNASSTENNSTIGAPKNLNQESKKESLSYEFAIEVEAESDFPNDMKARWKKFEKSGKFANSKKEREIFQELFITHGKQFFDNCGKVISFLEIHGTGKSGEEGKIHSPMVWINGHWEMNFSRYQTWLLKEQALKVAQTQKAEKDAQIKAKEKELAEAKAREEQEQIIWQTKMDAASRRFLNLYPSENEVNAFAETVIQHSGCPFTRNSWNKMGWESPVVKSFVISQFLKTEEQNALTQGTSRIMEATA